MSSVADAASKARTPAETAVVSRTCLAWMVRGAPYSIRWLQNSSPYARVMLSAFSILGARRLLDVVGAPPRPPSFPQPIDLFLRAHGDVFDMKSVGASDMPFYETACRAAGREDFELFAVCLAQRYGCVYLCHGKDDIELAHSTRLDVVCRQVPDEQG